jgi:hypothetical protein
MAKDIDWKARALKAEAKLKKKKDTDVSSFVRKNLDQFKFLLDPNPKGRGIGSILDDGKPRYFAYRAKGTPNEELIFKFNLFVRELLEAKILSNPKLIEEQYKPRRSMDLGSLVEYLGKHLPRAKRPGSGPVRVCE